MPVLVANEGDSFLNRSQNLSARPGRACVAFLMKPHGRNATVRATQFVRDAHLKNYSDASAFKLPTRNWHLWRQEKASRLAIARHSALWHADFNVLSHWEPLRPQKAEFSRGEAIGNKPIPQEKETACFGRFSSKEK